MSELQDFNFVCDIFKNFLSEFKIRKSLKTITEYDLSGWEKWLQIEFCLYLSSHEEIDDWKPEDKYFLDGRIAQKKFAFIDFSFRKRNTSTNLRIGVELKINKSHQTCLTKMFEDWDKLDSIKESENDLRSCWVVGIHGMNGISKNAIEDKTKKMLKPYGYKIKYNQFTSFPVGNTSFACTIF